jgi:cell division protein FtsQ
MSERASGNRRNKAAKARSAVINAPRDPVVGGDDSPLPGPATTSLRPPSKRAESRISRGLQLVAGATVVVAASIGVAWGARRYVTSSPRFAVRTVLVEGERRRSAAAVADAAGVAVGKNIFALDLHHAG